MSAATPTGGAGAVDAPLVELRAVGLAPRTLQLLSDYLELTKPKVQTLLLLTTIATMYVCTSESFIGPHCSDEVGGSRSA